MVCPGCGADNPEDASFCSLCLHRFSEPTSGGAAPGYHEAGEPGARFQPGAEGTPTFDSGTPFSNSPPVSSGTGGGTGDCATPPLTADPPDFAAGSLTPPAPPPDFAFGSQPPAPGYMSAAGQAPNGPASPPSEWGGGFPPPPPAPARSGAARALTSSTGKVLGVVLSIAFFALGYLGMGYFLNHRTATYKSSISDISFQYPGGWKKLNPGRFSAAIGFADLGAYNEILLADSTGDDMKYFLGVGSTPLPSEQWESYKESIRQQFQSAGVKTAGTMSVSVSGVQTADSAVGGMPALEVRFSANSAGYDFDCHARVVNHGGKIYLLLFLARGDRGSATSQIKEVLDSVEFK